VTSSTSSKTASSVNEPDEETLRRLQLEAAFAGIVNFMFGETMDPRGVMVNQDGAQYWYWGRHRHRDDGPAIIRADGAREWWREGVRYNEDGAPYGPSPFDYHLMWGL
jgi:hypothetical protein